MHIVGFTWMFVVVLMALAEATSPQGTVLGAFFTLLLYGLVPIAIVLYLMGTPMRRRAAKRKEALESNVGGQGDGGGHAASAPAAAEREEPRG
jgi:membrane protein implicated in regulation of membrane protease activity